MTEPLLAALQQWILFTGVVLSVGCVAWRLVVAPGAVRLLGEGQTSPLGAIERRVASVGLRTALVLIGAWGLRMVVQVMGFRDPFVPLWDDVSFLLFEMFWGTVWMAQGVTLALLVVAFWAVRRHATAGETDGETATAQLGRPQVPLAWQAAAVLVLILVATLALSGHAMGVDAWRSLIVTADGVHALAAGTWIGSLCLIVWVGRPEEGSPAALEIYAGQLRSFSPMAIASVSALLAMGIVLSWTHLGAVSDLWTRTYGRVLSAKIGVAGLVFGAGFLNWRKGVPALGTEVGSRTLQRRAAWEVSLALGVLLLTAVLVHSPKP